MRNIWKVKSESKMKFEDILRVCNKGDIILLSPGEYHFPKGLFFQGVKEIDIIGVGKNPSEVVIKGSFGISGPIKVTISNLTINALHKKNALNINKDATVELKKVIINGESTGGYPAIFCNQSNVKIEASEVYFSKDKNYGINIEEQSEVQIRSSIIDSITSLQSNVRLHNNQINVTMVILNDTIVKSTGVLDFPTNHTNDYNYFIFLQSGSKMELDLININNNGVLAKIEHSEFRLKEMKAADNLVASVHYNKQSTVDVPEEKVYLVNLDEQERQQVSSHHNERIDGTLDDSVDEGIDEENSNQKSEEQQSGLEELQSLYGLHDLKKQINEFINLVKFNQLQKEKGLSTIPITLHSLFMGNPGTGKTTVARIVGRVLYETGVISTNKFVEVTRKDLVGQYIGETAKMTQAILEESKGGILFIDEAYSLYSESANDFGKEAVDTILTFMEDNRHNTMIIFAGYTNEMNQFLKLNSGLESRIPQKFYFDDYTSEEIAEIGYSNLIKQGYVVNEKKYQDVIKWLYSHSVDKSNARWVRNINEKLLRIHANRVVESATEDTQTIIDEDLEVLTGNQKHNKDDMIGNLLNQLDSLMGLDEVKEYVHHLIKQAKVDRMLMEEGSVSNKPSYHMIFAGNPGTGKTTVANIIAQLFYYLDIMPTPNVKVVDRSDLVGAYIGHTEKQTKEILEQAMGGVLFIDEAYQLTGTSDNDFGKQAIETLLTYLENYRDKFVVILAGYTEEMDEFLKVNPGLQSRIPRKIIFPDYSPNEIAMIVEKIITKDWEVNVPLLKSTVVDIYKELPSNEKSNARWARNFSERLVQNHKAWVGDHPSAMNQLKKINDEVIYDLQQYYLNSINI